MAKRTNTAVWIESRGRWQINVQKDGQRRTFMSVKPGRTGQREANAKADAWLDDGIVDTRIMVEKAYSQFLERAMQVSSKGNWRPMETRWRIWIQPHIGRRRLDALHQSELQGILDAALSAGRSKKYIKSIQADLRAFYRFCKSAGYTATDMPNIVIPASARAGERTILQPDDVRRLMSVDKSFLKGRECFDDFVHYYRLAVLTGMRPGELLGLRWSDVQPDSVLVQGSINMYKERTRGKNDNAIRRVMLSSYAQREMLAQRQLTGAEGGPVFRQLSEHGVYLRWRKFCKHNGLPDMSLYELRHTFVSMMQASMNEAMLKPIVGHSQNMDTFGVYGHAFGDAQSATTAVMDGVMGALLSR